MKRGLLWLFGLTLALTACASETHLPYRSWYVGFSNPPHMEALIEDAYVVDVTGRHFYNLGVGPLSDNSGTNTSITVVGWASNSGDGPGRDLIGAALPKQIYVRWQSLVEPQTYQATLDIPETVRKLMLTQGPPDPAFKHPVPGAYYYNRINLGLAPGGWIKVWAGGVLTKPIPVMCVKATVVPGGPYGGKVTYGKKASYWKLSPSTQSYLKAHTIPYASWDCNAH